METSYHSLGSNETNRAVKILQIIFGVACIGIAVFWLVFNSKSLRSDKTLWITIVFLTGFGAYQIWAGLGRSNRYIEISSDIIQLKKNAVLPVTQMKAGDIDRIEFYPLSVIFFFKSGKKLLLRFGTIYHETNEKIVDVLIAFAESHSIAFQIIEEEI